MTRKRAAATNEGEAVFCVEEALLGERLGVSRDTLMEVRREVLEVERDWRLLHGRVMLTEAARGAVEAYMGLARKKIAAGGGEGPALREEGDAGVGVGEDSDALQGEFDGALTQEVVTGRIARFFGPRGSRKQRIVGIVVNGESARMRAPRVDKFVIGMEVPVTLLGPGLYLLARKAPRWRGKW